MADKEKRGKGRSFIFPFSRADARRFTALLGRLSADKAAALSYSLIALAESADQGGLQPNDLRFFVPQAFASLAGRMPEDRATAVAQKAVSIGVKATKAVTVLTLSGVYEKLAGRLPAEQASGGASALAEKALSLAAQAPAGAALDRRYLSWAFAALAGRLPPDQAARGASALAHHAVSAAAKLPDSQTQASVFQAVAGSLGPPEAAAMAGQITALAGKESDADPLSNAAGEP